MAVLVEKAPVGDRTHVAAAVPLTCSMGRTGQAESCLGSGLPRSNCLWLPSAIEQRAQPWKNPIIIVIIIIVIVIIFIFSFIILFIFVFINHHYLMMSGQCEGVHFINK